jgi:hypothetical protein
MFPQPLVLAATFDPDLARDVYAAISDELRAKHNAELASTGQAKCVGLGDRDAALSTPVSRSYT